MACLCYQSPLGAGSAPLTNLPARRYSASSCLTLCANLKGTLCAGHLQIWKLVLFDLRWCKGRPCTRTVYWVAAALREVHVGERFLLRRFTPHSVPQAYRRNWKELTGGTHHANRSENCCDTGRCRRNRRRQRGSSRGLVRLSLSLLPSSCLLSLPSPSLLRLLPLLPSSLSPSLLAPLVLARSFFSTASLWRLATAVLATKRVRQFATLAATFAPHCA